MATVVLSSVADTFPVGTTVGAYVSAPTGPAVTTAVVQSTGSLTFAGLADGTEYVAAASVNDVRRTRNFITPPASSLADIETAAEASAVDLADIEVATELSAERLGSIKTATEASAVDLADIEIATESSAVNLDVLTSGVFADGTPFSMNVGPSDAFGRLRVSDPETLFDVSHQYDKQPLLIEETLTAGGTATHAPAHSSVDMVVTNSGDAVVRQSRQYIRYQPGKSQLALMTFDMGAADANVRNRVGLFDAANGVFVQRAGTAVSIVRRTSSGGSPSDASAVAQADWNVDKLDGTGPSGLTLNLAQSQIFWTDLEWLGVGTVRAGFVIDGAFINCHHFHHANNGSGVYMSTANLPIRWETTATGAPGAARTLRSICASVISEGGFEDARGFPRAAGNGATPISVTTRRPILSIRPSATFNSIVNRSLILLDAIELTASGNAAYWELVYGGSLTNSSFATVGANAAVDFDVAATAITDGITIQCGHVVASQGSTRNATRNGIASRLPLTLDAAGSNPLILSVVVTSMSGTASVSAALNWRNMR
jgi:hypothetical protein